MYVYGGEFIVEDLTIESTVGWIGQALELHTAPPRGDSQIVRLLGHQDTLFTREGSVQQSNDCYVGDGVDFIVGAATAPFDDCTIIPKRSSALSPPPPAWKASTTATSSAGPSCACKRATTCLGRAPVRADRLHRQRPGPADLAQGLAQLGQPGCRGHHVLREFRSKGSARSPRSARAVISGDEASGYTAEAILGARQPLKTH